ncbi:hypothetical protein NV379_06490 [Paenibacillus sp. N1-5-1-14]|uniref:hypothetical protein n=1 Tax=Paenibacillus radicibacter TaxID=2972488 RepID=UPI002158F2B5|nr:hypothetical protein [Paenibacillus radicibacter]MCR8642305.1 hypothetical protein [Paenibacillus radicibacter]
MLSNSMREAIITVDQLTARAVSSPLLLGGSAGLLLQGVLLQAAPRDLDYYTDIAYTQTLSRGLQAYAVDALCESQTDIYYSMLSHYDMGGVSVELVGGFRVTARDSVYQVDVSFLSENGAIHYELEGRTIRLMPLSHELLFNVLRKRHDRYEPIAEAMLPRLEDHQAILQQLLAQGTWSDEVLTQIERLLGIELYYQMRG